MKTPCVIVCFCSKIFLNCSPIFVIELSWGKERSSNSWEVSNNRLMMQQVAKNLFISRNGTIKTCKCQRMSCKRPKRFMEMCEQAMKWFPEGCCCQCLMPCPAQCWNDKSLRPLPTYHRHCGPPQPPSDTIPGLKGTILQFYPNTKFTTKLTTSDCVGVLHFPLRPRICQFIYVVLVGSWNVLCLCCIFSSLVVFWLL